jgi:hypothetical protein
MEISYIWSRWKIFYFGIDLQATGVIPGAYAPIKQFPPPHFHPLPVQDSSLTPQIYDAQIILDKVSLNNDISK